MQMPFTQPPDFENATGWSSFVGKYAIVEPQHKEYQIQTKFGTQDAYDCIVWELIPGTNTLNPTSGVRIFNQRLVNALDVAYKTGQPLAGFVRKGGSNGNTTIIESDGSPTMTLLEKLWAEMFGAKA
jgi:hypothetical protein